MMKFTPLQLGIAAALVVIIGLGGYFALRGGGHAASPADGADTSELREKIDLLKKMRADGQIDEKGYQATMATLLAQASNSGAPASADTPNGAAASGDFHTIDGEQGGHIVAGQMGALPDTGAATAAILRKVHDAIGDKPQIVQAMTDPTTNSATFVFTANQGGQPINGIGFVSAPQGGNASGYAVYDTAQRFGQTAGKLLGEMQNGGAAGGAQEPMAPPEPMTTQMFSDGTGSIAVPGDWHLAVANGGSAMVLGPGSELVAYNVATAAMDPNNPLAANLMRNMPPVTYNYTMKSTVMLAPISDPASAWQALFAQRAAQNGQPAPVFNIQHVEPMQVQSGGIQSQMATLTGDATLTGTNGAHHGQFLAIVQVMPPNSMGQWSMISTWIFVSDQDFRRYAQTASAILSSVRINFARVNEIGAEVRAQFQQQVDNMIARAKQEDAARAEQHDNFMAGLFQHEDNMQKQATAMENYVLDRAVIRNDVTGEHYLVSGGFSTDWVRGNPDYHVLAPSELVHGIDF
jgi:hypothetical protein